ncbi:MAG: hypothetical protein HY040_01955 [Planctomycetes bacterium]|nr:hypothetical protein [Planctomycetota bacterium]
MAPTQPPTALGQERGEIGSPSLRQSGSSQERLEATGEELWQKGQLAMQAGQAERAIALYRQSLKCKEAPAKNHLSLAAAFVTKGDDAAACYHLGVFLESNPEHRNARLYHAELLLKLKRFTDSRWEFDQAIAEAQEDRFLDRQHLLHCHARLLEMAEALQDDYREHLHRGISFFLLAQERLAAGDPEGELPVEALLCRAAGQLTTARSLRPEEARTCWYLHAVWRQLGQSPQSRRWLQEATRLAPFSYLTPAERRALQFALAS